MKRILVASSMLVGILLGRGPLSGREPHYLFIYPDKTNLEKWIECGVFETTDEARAAVRSWLKIFPGADYEIGIGKPENAYGVKVFRETVR